MKPTLAQIFLLGLLAIVATLAGIVAVVDHSSREALLESSERAREQAAREIAERLSKLLAMAPGTVGRFQDEVRRGLIDPHDALALERALFTLLLEKSELGEITLTFGEATGFDAEGNLRLAPGSRGQWSVARGAGAAGAESYASRRIFEENGVFVSERRAGGSAPAIASWPLLRESRREIADPTAHDTFKAPCDRDHYGELLTSDLHPTQLDADLPEAEQRMEVSVQQVVTDAAGKFLGVLRVGLLASQLDGVVRLALGTRGESDPHRIFLCDAEGRLITRFSPADRWREYGSGVVDIRVAPETLPVEVLRAVADSGLRAVGPDRATLAGGFRMDGQEYLTTFRYLPDTQDWLVGIVVPREHYLGRLTAMRRRLLETTLGLSLLLAMGGAFVVASVRRAQARVVTETSKMNAFNFAPARTDSGFRDVTEVLEGLESAKASLRALAKYAPLDLVRRLYREKSEPRLGGEPRTLSIMFSDIKGFTRFSERLPPQELADGLGQYLDALSRIIQQETHGTIDKFIGDAIMAIWNAPELVAHHERLACLAALRCQGAVRALAAAPAWRGLPAFETRIGLHAGPALVGHFGAHDRMNYTAIGDAVNLASRLEGLNKRYGTSIIASESIVEAVGGEFAVRLLDRVAVVGKSHAVKVYELIGKGALPPAVSELVAAYERALTLYGARDFDGAAAIFRAQAEVDPPSAELLGRSQMYMANPPSPDWDGVYRAESK